MKNSPRSTHMKSSQEGAYGTLPALIKKLEISRSGNMPDDRQHRCQIEKSSIVLDAQERERNAIGMELHDNVNQILVCTKLLLSAVQAVAPGDQVLVATCIANLQKAIDENRRISHELVAPDFSERKLTDQIEALVYNLLPQGSAEVQVDYAKLDENVLQPQQKLAIYRIAQEQCTNIVKYAEAKNVKITLGTNDRMFYMKISDDGKGLQPNKKLDGIGLQNISSRVVVLHGSSHIYSKPGKGFTLEIQIPLAA